MDAKSVVTRSLDALGLERGGRLRTTLNKRYEHFRSKRRVSEQGFLSFSQFGEDAVVNSLLRASPFRGQVGRYLDIGSGEPIRGSNTYALYRQGWSGTLVDPIERNVFDSQRFRPRDRCIRACVGDASGMVDFVEFGTYEFSTASPARIEEMLAGGSQPTRQYQVPMVTISELDIKMSPDAPTVMSIDVEGGEEAVLDGINWETCCPGIMVIEEWEAPLGRESSLMRRLADHDYQLVAVVVYSSIYRHMRFPRQ